MVCLTYKYKTKFSTGSSWLKSKDGRDQTKQKMYTWSVSWSLFLQNDMLNVEWASPFSSGRHYFPDVSSQGIITVSLQTWSPIPPSCRHSVLSSPVRGRLAFHLPFVTLTLGSSHPALSAWSNPPIQRLCQMIRHNGWITCFSFPPPSEALGKFTLLNYIWTYLDTGQARFEGLCNISGASMAEQQTGQILIARLCQTFPISSCQCFCLLKQCPLSTKNVLDLAALFSFCITNLCQASNSALWTFQNISKRQETTYSIVWLLVPFDLMSFWRRDTKQLPMLQDLLSFHLTF